MIRPEHEELISAAYGDISRNSPSSSDWSDAMRVLFISSSISRRNSLQLPAKSVAPSFSNVQIARNTSDSACSYSCCRYQKSACRYAARPKRYGLSFYAFPGETLSAYNLYNPGSHGVFRIRPLVQRFRMEFQDLRPFSYPQNVLRAAH